jgi:hypothetical protein
VGADLLIITSTILLVLQDSEYGLGITKFFLLSEKEFKDRHMRLNQEQVC